MMEAARWRREYLDSGGPVVDTEKRSNLTS